MGQLYLYMPFECFAAAICLFNLAGLPFSYGFYIKHLLFISLGNNLWFYYLVLFLCNVAAITGIFYSSRIIYYVFFDVKKGKKNTYVSTSRIFLKSKYFSNSSISAQLAISLLILVAYSMIIYLFFIYRNFFFSDFIFNFSFGNIFEKMQFNKSLQNYYSYINWTVLCFVFSYVFINWRKIYYPFRNYDLFFFICIFSLIFWIFFNLI